MYRETPLWILWESARALSKAPSPLCSAGALQITLGPTRSITSLHNLTYLFRHTTERTVNFNLAHKRLLHRAPQNFFNFRIARELWRNQDVFGNHLLQHSQPSVVFLVRLVLHLHHHRAAYRHT